jgi:hypothetical protein
VYIRLTDTLWEQADLLGSPFATISSIPHMAIEKEQADRRGTGFVATICSLLMGIHKVQAAHHGSGFVAGSYILHMDIRTVHLGLRGFQSANSGTGSCAIGANNSDA